MYSKSEDWSGSCASMQFRSSKCSKCLFANEMESLGVEKCGSNIIGVLVMVCHYKNDVHWLLQMKTFESNEIRFRSFSPPSLSLSLFLFLLISLSCSKTDSKSHPVCLATYGEVFFRLLNKLCSVRHKLKSELLPFIWRSKRMKLTN